MEIINYTMELDKFKYIYFFTKKEGILINVSKKY